MSIVYFLPPKASGNPHQDGPYRLATVANTKNGYISNFTDLKLEFVVAKGHPRDLS